VDLCSGELQFESGLAYCIGKGGGDARGNMESLLYEESSS
jgi:hypothetical protein